MPNPYAGTAQEADWQTGFQAGLVVPDQPISAPLVLSPDSIDAYNDGVAAGQFVNSALLPIEPAESTPEAIVHWAHIADDVGGPIVSAFNAGQTKTAFRAALTAGVEIVFNIVLLVAIWGPRRDNFIDDIVASRLAEVRSVIASGNGSDSNQELFMAVSDSTDPDGDPLLNGVWHGLFRLTFDEAQQDALSHDQTGHTLIHRYQTAQPTIVDVLTL